jgi:NitT/TauT family transport system substrate-binding protein
MTRRDVLAAGLAVLLGATTASAADAPTPFKLTLNFLAAGPQAGFMYAKKLGFYKEAGIDLTIEEGKGSATTAQLVATGQTDAGFADAPAAMQIRSKGAPVKIIAPVLQTNGFAIIALAETGINAPRDLIGKKLAVQPGTAQTTLLDAILSENKIGPDQINVINIDPSAFVGSLLEKRVDAILGGADFHSIQITDRGFKTSEMFYRDVGVPTVGLSIIARDDRLKADPELYRKFVEASLKGWDEARRDPEAASAAVVEQFPSATPDQTLKQLKVDLLLVCAPGATSLGHVPEKNWQRSFELLTAYLGLPKDHPITDYYTDDFLPAKAPACPS